MEKIIYVIIVALAAYLLVKVLSSPIKKIFKLLLNTILGFVLLFIVNLIGTYFNFSVDVTILTCLITGIFGVPGAVLLVLLKIFVL